MILTHGYIPTTTEIKRRRKQAGLTQAEAAALIYKSRRAWLQWEHGDRHMDSAFWELFVNKTEPLIGILSGNT